MFPRCPHRQSPLVLAYLFRFLSIINVIAEFASVRESWIYSCSTSAYSCVYPCSPLPVEWLFFFWFVRLFVLNGISCEIKLAIIVVLLAFIVSSGKNDYKKLEWNSLIGVLRNVKLPFQCVLRHLNEISMTSRP